MPAIRSRTEHWLDNLRKIHERGGALEISIDRSTSGGSSADETGSDVAWRVRVIRVAEDHIVVEPPAAFGATIDFETDIALIGAMTIGQNRWMFHTRTLGHIEGARPGDRHLVLALPERVERCTRRSFFRISTANLQLPRVQCWPLNDPSSVGAAEAANRCEIRDLLEGDGPGNPGELLSESSLLLPDVGPAFKASLLNVSGGGLGLLVAPEDAAALSARPYLWIRLDLRPHIPAPAAVTARIAHTHTDSSQHIYAGLAFDFSQSSQHRRFIVELLGRYIESLQRQQRGTH
ncbi:MAG: hypothetical protein IT438_01910 [Phycisphaerales bacterium]|nr:hypothetical protein [Phycisphaerales bacterium]